MGAPQQNIDLTGSGLPTRLVALREARRLTKADLADRAGLSYRTIHELESDRRDRIQEKTLMLLAEALQVPVDELLGRPLAAVQVSAPDPAPEVPAVRPPRRRRRPGRRGMLALLSGLLVVLAASLVHLRSFARANARWTHTPEAVSVHDGVFGLHLWELRGENRIPFCQPAPWSPQQLLVGLGSQTPDGGQLLCLERASGDTLWTLRPDVAAMVRAFGEADVLAAPFNCCRPAVADLDGDGRKELIVQFVHGRYYPNAICAVDETGRLLGQYAHKGHLSDWAVCDLDGDGRDEFIGCGTNNAPDYQGAALLILDGEHFRGASLDSLCDPWSSEPDSARLRLVIPQYPAPYMRLLEARRLAARNLKIYRNATGEIMLSVSVGSEPENSMLVYLDADLHPKSCEPEDRFAEKTISHWPDSLVVGAGPGDPAWRAGWLAGHRRFAAGHWPPVTPKK